MVTQVPLGHETLVAARVRAIERTIVFELKKSTTKMVDI